MALALGAICMPSQASAAEVASPVANNVKAATPLAAPSGDVIIVITDDGHVIIIETE